uniref:CCHC-type domain-containing protein n=1 Tax=Ananas comosus var. bracteatus TaxID=296719 RepID=A0A6V7NWR6_ANACO|nr:unnamed protein product [Ananas comosus var. bracteatus]
MRGLLIFYFLSFTFYFYLRPSHPLFPLLRDLGCLICIANSSSKKVICADLAGTALTQTVYFNHEDHHCKDGSLTAYQPEDTSKTADFNCLDTQQKKEKDPINLFKHTYKEALLSSPLAPTPPPLHPPAKPASSFPLVNGYFSFKGRCFRCLGRDHRASHCRDPVRCTTCFKSGHIARACMNCLPLPVYRMMRARPSHLSAFVPLSDDFIARQNRRRNAILVVVLPPANLGHFPQDTIAKELASRFGGYPNDFHVARYSVRDYVVFLPDLVPSDRIIRRDVLNLGLSDSVVSPGIPTAALADRR